MKTINIIELDSYEPIITYEDIFIPEVNDIIEIGNKRYKVDRRTVKILDHIIILYVTDKSF